MPATEQIATPNEVKIPSCVCPACGAIDPETEYIPAQRLCDPRTGYRDPEGYRCMECGALSESEDWERLSGEICCECGKVGTKHCVCPREEDELEQARRRAPIRKPVLPEMPAGFRFEEKEVA